MTLLGVGLIGFQIFEQVRPEVGGGSPSNANFYFGTDGKDMLTYLRSTSNHYHDNDPAMTINGDLLYASSDRLLIRIAYCKPDVDNPKVLVGQFQPVMIERKVVQAILFTFLSPTPPTKNCPFSAKP